MEIVSRDNDDSLCYTDEVLARASQLTVRSIRLMDNRFSGRQSAGCVVRINHVYLARAHAHERKRLDNVLIARGRQSLS